MQCRGPYDPLQAGSAHRVVGSIHMWDRQVIPDIEQPATGTDSQTPVMLTPSRITASLSHPDSTEIFLSRTAG